jgi:hypothetical protein
MEIQVRIPRTTKSKKWHKASPSGPPIKYKQHFAMQYFQLKILLKICFTLPEK